MILKMFLTSLLWLQMFSGGLCSECTKNEQIPRNECQRCEIPKTYDEILQKLKSKNQLFLITHLLNAKDFLKLASSNKEYFENMNGNLDKLQGHLNRDFIEDFRSYFTLPFPDDTLSAMEYFHMFCLHFGTEMSYSPQYVDYLRRNDKNIYKIDESSSRSISVLGQFDDKVVNGQRLVSFSSNASHFMTSFRDFQFSGPDPLVCEKQGKLYNRRDKLNLFTLPLIDYKNKIFYPFRLESDEYRVCMFLTLENYRKCVRKFPTLDE